jgi:carbon-monoxide dehydrogenase medium subunit
MKPAAFQYFAPVSLSEALDLTAKYGPTQKVLAGGQSLVPLMNMRLVRPDQLIDMNRVGGLDFVREEETKLVIGAMARHRAIESSDLVRRTAPLLSEAVRYIGHMQIRTRGTMGGSVSHADPAAEIPCVLAAHEGEVVIASSRGERTVGVGEFFVSVFTTVLEADEVVTAVKFNKTKPSTGWAFLEVAKRSGDFALVSAAVLVSLINGTIADARIALGSVAERPLRVSRAEAILNGAKADDDVLAAATSAITEDLTPTGDVHASADYRRHVAGVLTQRCLNTALSRARNGHDAGFT